MFRHDETCSRDTHLLLCLRETLELRRCIPRIHFLRRRGGLRALFSLRVLVFFLHNERSTRKGYRIQKSNCSSYNSPSGSPCKSLPFWFCDRSHDQSLCVILIEAKKMSQSKCAAHIRICSKPVNSTWSFVFNPCFHVLCSSRGKTHFIACHRSKHSVHTAAPPGCASVSVVFPTSHRELVSASREVFSARAAGGPRISIPRKPVADPSPPDALYARGHA